MDKIFTAMIEYLAYTEIGLEDIEKLTQTTLAFFQISEPTMTHETLYSNWSNYLIGQQYVAIATPTPAPPAEPSAHALHLKGYPITEAGFLATLNASCAVTLNSAEMAERLAWIDAQERHEQRSEEWYALRNTLVTASSAHEIFKSASSRKALVRSKAFPQKHRGSGGGAACLHGIKFEPVATELYSLRNSVVVGEYGCIRHASISHLGASPDGIVTSAGPLQGTMLEIKCPYTREITGFPPPYYWIQVQLQLEVCNLEQCDFLECKFMEYKTINDFTNRSSTAEAGIIIEYQEGNERKYSYSELGASKEEYGRWYDAQINAILDDDRLFFNRATFWSVDKYVCTRIVRDRAWFASVRGEIDQFWADVLERQKSPPSPTPARAETKPVEYGFLDG